MWPVGRVLIGVVMGIRFLKDRAGQSFFNRTAVGWACYSPGIGKWYKRRLNRAYRRLGRAFCREGERAYRHTGVLESARSDVNYRGW